MKRLATSLCVALGIGVSGSAMAGWFDHECDGPAPGTPEYYEYHASQPVGQRQRYWKGKLWPVQTRPVGEHSLFVHQFHHNYHWPHPYVEADRQSVMQYVDIQVANGWRESATLYEYHFDPVTHELNSAGRQHLHWILSNVPQQFRTPYVQSNVVDPDVNELRLASVQAEAGRVVGEAYVPPIALRVTSPVSSSAEEMNAIFEFRRATPIPPPVVQYGNPAGGSGGAFQ